MRFSPLVPTQPLPSTPLTGPTWFLRRMDRSGAMPARFSFLRFSLKKLDSFEHVRVEERMAFISGLYSAAVCKNPVLLRDHLVRFTLSTITRIVTGHKYYTNESELRKADGHSIPFKKLQEFLDDWFLLGGVINLGDWIPWLSCFDLQGYVKKMKAFRDEYSKFLDYVIEDHRAMMKAADDKNFVPKDIVDVFLQIADDPTLDAEEALTRDRLRGLIHDMLAGSTDTTATSVEWVFQELFRKPWIIEKAKEELDRVIGRERWVEEKDLSQLPYIEAIVKETLRLHPVATLLPPHYSMEDCKVGGYEVPKGTVVFINVWSIGRYSKYWDKANEFLPERFLERDIDITGQNFGVLPFGSGRRKCPGYSLGLKALPWLLAIAFLFKISTIYQRRKAKTPPGPRPWPIIGNLNLLGSTPHQSLHSLSQKYGELMLLKFGSKPVIVASSPETAKLFLKTHDAVFASRPATAAAHHTFNRSDMTWSPYGPFWRHARKILLSQVFAPTKLDSFEYVRVEERTTLISRLYDAVGTKKPVLLRDHLVRFTLSTITRLVTGNKYFSNDWELGKPEGYYSIPFKKLLGFLDEWFLLSGVINLGDWVPWLSGLDLQGYVKKMKAFREEYEKFLNYVIDDHMAMMKGDENFVPKDMVDVFLQIADDPNLEPWIIEKAIEELNRVIGRERWVEEKDFSQLPYIDAIIKETFRLHPICTLVPPHYSIEDCIVAGYEVPKGTTVLINVWSIGRNPKYWDNANEFRPERFLEKDVDIKGQDFTLLPFGAGRRRCPGYSLGMKIVRTTLANLLHGFNWKLAGDLRPKDISMEEVYGLTTHPKSPLSYIIEPRLPTHLY
nr:cytochrome P450 71A1-like [Ipomoea batatas]